MTTIAAILAKSDAVEPLSDEAITGLSTGNEMERGLFEVLLSGDWEPFYQALYRCFYPMQLHPQTQEYFAATLRVAKLRGPLDLAGVAPALRTSFEAIAIDERFPFPGLVVGGDRDGTDFVLCLPHGKVISLYHDADYYEVGYHAAQRVEQGPGFRARAISQFVYLAAPLTITDLFALQHGLREIDGRQLDVQAASAARLELAVGLPDLPPWGGQGSWDWLRRKYELDHRKVTEARQERNGPYGRGLPSRVQAPAPRTVLQELPLGRSYATEMRIAFDPDTGQLLVGESGLAHLRRIDPRTGAIETEEAPEPIDAVCFGPDTMVALAASGAVYRRSGGSWRKLTDGRCYCELLLGPDGKTLALVAGDSGEEDVSALEIWDLANGQCITRFRHPGILMGMAFLRDGRLALNMWNGTLSVGDPRQGTFPLELDVCYRGPDLAVQPGSGKIFVSGEESVEVWSPAGLPLPRLHTGRRWRGRLLALSGDGRWLAGLDADVELWDLRRGTLAARTTEFLRSSVDLAFSPDSCFLAATTESDLFLWDLADLPAT